jgi:hypothetical protein
MNGESQMIRKGDVLTIKPQWRDAGDETLMWVARSDEEKGRLDISALILKNLPLWPVQTVSIDMVEKTGKRHVWED